MGFQLSPGVNVTETDLTNSIAGVSTTGGGFVGQFHWGAVEEFVLIENKTRLEARFGKPSDVNFVDWFSARNFLAYSNALQVVRVVEATAKNASADGTGVLIKNEEHYETVASGAGAQLVAAKYPGALGNSLAVHMADASTFSGWAYEAQFDAAPSTSEYAESLGNSSAEDEVHIVIVDEDGEFTGVPGAVLEKFAFLSKAKDAKSLDGEPIFYGNVLNKQSEYVWWLADPLAASYVDNGVITAITVTDGGTGYSVGDAIAITGDGAGATAEVETEVGGVITSIIVTNGGSGYTTATVDATGTGNGDATGTATITTQQAWNTNITTTGLYQRLGAAIDYPLSAGNDGSTITSSELITGWDMFKNSEVVDVSLLFAGDGGGSTNSVAVIQNVIDNIIEVRKDAMFFFSPDKADVFNVTPEAATSNAVDFKNVSINRTSSYAVMDSGWKYQYDVYNDKYRYIPLNADIAGLAARTDNTNDPWYSPAGYTRGRIKNVISLPFNPSKGNRDELYKNGVNPVVSEQGEGVILYGDRTMKTKSSAFSKINIRRLFIVLEKAIARAAKQQLFEFNDQFTRAQFKNLVEPFLREVKGRRGIYDFAVVCDDSNNTPEVIDRSEFVADIYIKPAYSINFIQLNFVAVRTGVEFEEIIGVSNSGAA